MAGKIDQAKGAVKETVGKATGDERTEAEGKTDKAKGKFREGIDKVKNAARSVRDSFSK